DITPIPGTEQLLAADEAAHELLLLEGDGSSVSITQRLPISAYPVSINVAPDGKSATIASLWSRRLTFVVLERGALRISRIVDLPFAPRGPPFLSCQHSPPLR